VIESYLRELDRALRPLGAARRSRVLAEARAHLLDAAAASGEEAAIARFGPVGEVARAHLSVAAGRASRRAVVVFGSAGLAYGAVQALASPALLGLFPGGPWPGDLPPGYLRWKVDVAGLLVAVAALLGGLALVAAWRGSRAVTARLCAAGAVLFAASWPFETVFLFQRGNDVAGSPSGLVTGAVAAAFLAGQVAAVTVAWRALRLTRAVPE
jgi:hypothetical protein